MENDKFEVFLSSIESAFNKVVKEMLDFDFQQMDGKADLDKNTVSVIIGMTGKNKGRILFEIGEKTAEAIAISINGEPLEDAREIYLYLAEFTNIFCGNAVTLINNRYKGTELRLTPPAVFAGEDVEITTPNIKSVSLFCTSQYGPALLDVGFEGV